MDQPRLKLTISVGHAVIQFTEILRDRCWYPASDTGQSGCHLTVMRHQELRDDIQPDDEHFPFLFNQLLCFKGKHRLALFLSCMLRTFKLCPVFLFLVVCIVLFFLSLCTHDGLQEKKVHF